MTSISSARIASIEARKHELAKAMTVGDLAPEEFVRLSKEYAAVEPVAAAAREVRRLRAERESLLSMTKDADDELRQMASDELHSIETS
ncbi:MAG: PCRF domain-containing protein, partial [Sphingomicrobium sp.]